MPVKGQTKKILKNVITDLNITEGKMRSTEMKVICKFF